MKRVLILALGAMVLSGCSWFGGGDNPKKHLTQKQQWEALGYRDGLQSVKQGP
ncbi:hypothetical protein J2D73_18360 [Acetobacter sacchari]|uniref:Lipoprotein n=1 Tax=Acetobacter sacchari TaxID=2661687 RepID=A0ABS3M0R5_9PROT|nr:hypothetical protein [Acetobacter sacchari]MBO1361748.1 hypothetical protein [Acetobacter sacchari]